MKVKRRVFGWQHIEFKVLYPDFKPAIPDDRTVVRIENYKDPFVEGIY